MSTPVTDDLPCTGFLRIKQVLELIPVGKSTWWAGVKSGRFPPSHKIGGSTMWRVEDIRKLIKNVGAHTS